MNRDYLKPLGKKEYYGINTFASAGELGVLVELLLILGLMYSRFSSG